jgi:hypothetical protein
MGILLQLQNHVKRCVRARTKKLLSPAHYPTSMSVPRLRKALPFHGTVQWRRVSYYWNRAVLPGLAGFISGSTLTWMMIDGKYQALHGPPPSQRLI